MVGRERRRHARRVRSEEITSGLALRHSPVTSQSSRGARVAFPRPGLGPWLAAQRTGEPNAIALLSPLSHFPAAQMTSKRPLSPSPVSQLDERPTKRVTTEAPSSSRDGPQTKLAFPSTSSTWNDRPVPFQQPTGLLTFSYTPQRALQFDNSALRYYVDPPPRADLRYGYERWIKRPEERARLDALLRAVERVMDKADARAGADSGRKWLRDIAVVTWRGVMTK